MGETIRLVGCKKVTSKGHRRGSEGDRQHRRTLSHSVSFSHHLLSVSPSLCFHLLLSLHLNFCLSRSISVSLHLSHFLLFSLTVPPFLSLSIFLYLVLFLSISVPLSICLFLSSSFALDFSVINFLSHSLPSLYHWDYF